MTLTELKNAVYSLTNRPDLTGQTLLAVQAATLKLHQSDYFYKDLFETGIQFTDELYTQQIEYATLIPRWRALKYLRKTDIDQSDDGEFFEVILPEQVLDSYNVNRDNVCYVAGSVIQIRSSTLLKYAILGCYRNPNITEASYDSWIARDHPFAIIYQAAADVLRQIGKQEESALLAKEYNDQLTAVRLSNIDAKGY